ncbi:MAG: hypothetical protein IJB01_06115 [Bacteroidaceae bacterium]|nr:hypothetical protein [Bacteroidaceae bacterium]
MRKFLLSMALVFCTAGAMAQGTIELTFNKTDATNATVEVASDAIDVAGITATVTSNYNWKTLTANNTTFPTASMLCPDKNTTDMTSGNEAVFTITLNNVPANYSFKNTTFTSAALTGGGAFQEHTETRHVDFTLKKGEEILGTKTDESIMVTSHNGTAVNIEFEMNTAYKAEDGTLTLTLTLAKGTNNNGCFYGLTKITFETITTLYHLSDKNLTASDLMSKTEPTYIAMKNLSRRNPDWYAGTSSSALITDANIFVWEPTDDGFRLKNLEGQYIQSGNENVNISFGTVDNAAVFTVVKPYVGGSETAAMDHDNDSNPYITSDQDENLVRFVNEKDVWINVQNTDGTPGTPKYNKGKRGWTIQYVYEVTMVEAYDVEITDAKYATFYAVSESTAPEGVEVYYVTNEGVESEKINLTKIENRIIPANTAVIIYSETAGNYEFSASTTNAPAISDNLLKGTPISTNITEEAYVLGNKDGVGLYKAITKDVSTSGGTKKVFLNNANKAYLPASAVPAAAQASNGFRFGEGTTGIDEITENRVQSTVIYDLTGRRVEAITAPGIYIVGGKKVLVK